MKSKTIRWILCCLLVMGGIVVTHFKLASLRETFSSVERFSYLPDSDKIKPYLCGFSTTYANFIWIKTMLYFGSHYMSDKQFPWLIHMIDMVTKLNPYYYPAYEFGGIIIPFYLKNADAARIILDRGIFYVGSKNYTLPFYMGWLYYNTYHEPLIAAHYLTLASHRPKAPAFIPALAATLYTKAGQSEIAFSFLQTLYYSTDNTAIKQTIRDKLEKLQKNQ